MASHMKSYAKLGETLHGKLEKVNSDILALTYGSLVTQLLKDGGDIEKVNTQLEQIGTRMGMRLVEEFLALSGIGTCKDFTETMEVLSKTAFKMFLGVTADVGDWDETKTKCTISFLDNPLLDFVELPAEMEKLDYSQIICGIIRGALEQLLISVSCHFIKDVLRGDAINEIRVELHSIRKEEFKDKYLSKNE